MIEAIPIWEELINSVPAHAGIVRRRVEPTSGRDLFLAVAHPSRERMLILSVSSEVVQPADQLPSTKGVHSTVVPIDGSRSEVRISLAAPEILRVFATFVEDVAMSAAAADDDGGAVGALATRFAHWRRLLAGEPRGGLGREAAQGLWGELWVLRHLLHPAWGEGAVDAWTGCDRDAKDFRRGRLAIEVKTTRADAPHAVRINGEHQLEEPGDGAALLLAVLDVDSHEQGVGETLGEVVASVRAVVSGPALVRLDEKLGDYGYLDADQDLYVSRRYVLRGALWYEVKPGFPRVTGQDLPEGVGRISYLLSTDAAAPWRLDDERLSRFINGALP